MSSIPYAPAAHRQKIMKTTVDVVIRCFFNPGCAGSAMVPDSLELIWETIPPGTPVNLPQSVPR
jgi:hypothetical protein